MRKFAWAIAALGCMATVGCGPDLRDFAVKMDNSAPKYGTPECQAARQKAIAFMNSEPGRLALAGGVGLIPLVGLPASLMLDRDEAKQADTMFDDLRLACGEAAFLPLAQEEAQKGNRGAQTWLAQAYDLGYGVQKNPAEAVRWYTLAAAQGDAAAEVNLGAHYANGLGVAEDDARAAALWQQAAADEVPEAQTNLALFYREGKGVPQDFAKAQELYRAAAIHGHGSAQLGLAAMYEKGEGIPRDDVAAYRWYAIAERYNAAGAGEKKAAAAARLSDRDKADADQEIRRCTSRSLRDCP